MATQSATLPIPITKAGNEIFLPAFTLWLREVVRFYRQRSRVVGVIASPILFWVAIGSGFGYTFVDRVGRVRRGNASFSSRLEARLQAAD